MKQLKKLFLLGCLFLPAICISQHIRLTGTITDSASRTPLQGATVTIVNSNTTTLTGDDGRFSIQAEKGAVLQISFVGYASKMISATSPVLNIALSREPATLMDETVVIGYGTQKKVNLTGAVSSVSAKDLERRPISNPGAMLQGLVPGLNVVQNSGQPGEDVVMMLRGNTTFSSGSAPLILIDGVEGRLFSLNPGDIKSISVLKDAASTSIYGSRAANGVILVTTKDGSGQAGKMNLTYDFNYGTHNPTKMLDLVYNSVDYMKGWNTYVKNQNYGVDIPSQEYPQSVIDQYQNASDPIQYPNFNWLDWVVNPAPTMIHNLSISGGTQTHYHASLGYTDEKGTMAGFNFKKYTGQFNIVSDVSKRLKIGINTILEYGNNNTFVDGYYSLFLVTISQAPTYKPTLPDGRIAAAAYPWEQHNWNPLAQINNWGRNIKDYRINSQIWADLEIVKGLHWYAKGAANYASTRTTDFSGTDYFLVYYQPPHDNWLEMTTSLNRTNDENIYKNFYSYLNYNKQLGPHRLSLMAGYSNEENDYNVISAGRLNYASPATPELNAGSSAKQTNGGTSNAWAIQSLFGRFNYNFKSKYLFEANVRYDGTSRLAPESRWGAFPSFSAGWRFSEEPFMNSARKWLTESKLRGSWGQVGNQDIGFYPYQALLSLSGVYPFDNSNLSQGVRQTTLANRNIKWETTTISDIGLDLVLFNKLSINFDVYKKLTENILRSAQVTAVVGLGAPTVNSGVMQNLGYDLNISYNDQVKYGALKGLGYGAGLVLSSFKNKIVKFGVKEISGNTIKLEGSPWGTFYVLDVLGIFQSQDEVDKSPAQFGQNIMPGMLKYRDVNGDGVVDNNDRIPITKGVYPAYTYGFNFNASWKNFDLYGFIQGVAGQKVYVNAWGLWPYLQGSPPTKDQYKNAWTPENKSNTEIMLGDPVSFGHNSTYFLKDDSYLRLKTLQIGYSLPAKWLSKIKIEKFRVYFSGDNLFTKTNYPGLDPERAAGGILINYPQNKVISFGCNLNF